MAMEVLGATDTMAGGGEAGLVAVAVVTLGGLVMVAVGTRDVVEGGDDTMFAVDNVCVLAKI